MRKFYNLILILVLTTLSQTVLAAPDTLTIRAHQNVHTNWYGNYDQNIKFPPIDSGYKKIILRYTLGCPTGGCSDWDYTTRVFARRKTAQFDTLVTTYPSFKVNGLITDSVAFTSTQTFTYFFNTTTQALDSTENPGLKIVFFSNPANPGLATDSLVGYPGAYYNLLFNAGGQVIDSVFVPADSIYRVSYTVDTIYNNRIEDIELARYITPYSGNRKQGFFVDFETDITDFSSVLAEADQIRVLYDGWSDGFTVSLDFLLIEGTPVQKAYKVVELYNGFFNYGDPANSIENSLVPKIIQIDSNARSASIRILQTGHGFGGNEDCAEFCKKYNYVKVDNVQRHVNTIWKDDCGLNPLYPQPGTWLYDRANWCPGEMVRPFINDLSPYVTAGQDHTIDIDMTPFINSGNNNCGYYLSAYLVYYEERAVTTDVELVEVVSPSNQWIHQRYNPVCGKPVVRVRNNGTSAITALRFNYGQNGGATATYDWTGSLLAPGAVSEIELDPVALSGSSNLFAVQVSIPSGPADQDLSNNSQTVTFSQAPVYPTRFVVEYRTNLAGYENSYEITNLAGTAIYKKDNLKNNTLYKDTVDLPEGCYMFVFNDTGKDGLSFFANTAGVGYARFRNMANVIFKPFNADFGTEIRHQFSTSPLVGLQQEKQAPDIVVYPNPATDQIRVSGLGVQPGQVSIRIYSILGQLLSENRINASGDELAIPLEQYNNGTYIIEIEQHGVIYRNKFLKTGKN